MSQAIMFPSRCLGCKSERFAVQDGRALYRCGTTIRVRQQRPFVQRSGRCMELQIASGEARESRPVAVGGPR